MEKRTEIENLIKEKLNIEYKLKINEKDNYEFTLKIYEYFI